jgi:hypothetical protein
MSFMTRFYHSFNLIPGFISLRKYLLLLLRLSFLGFSAVFVNSCEEGPTQIGSGLLPSNDFVTISSTDTLSIWSYTMYDSSVPTSSPAVALVGSIVDPYFGTTETEFVSQLRLGSIWNYGPVTIDSVKMYLKILAARGGNTTVGNRLILSEISDQIYTDSTYYSDTETNTTGVHVVAQLPVLNADTINDISVSLPLEFGDYLIRDTTKLFYSNTKEDFRSYFKGLYMQMEESSDPLLITFSLVSQAASGGQYNNFFVLYMHDTSYVSIRYYFILDPIHPNACYNRIIRDFSTADPDKRIEHINDMNYRDTLSYLQYLNGVYTKLVFPGLDSLKEMLSGHKISINKARVTIPVQYDGDRYTVLTVPGKLRLRYTDPDGVKIDVPDYYIGTNNNFFDGTLNAFDSTYYFNIPTYIQNYLEDTNNDYKPELEVYGGPSDLKSVILKANASKKPVRFELTYTKF